MPRLLVVDDNPDIHRDLRQILTPAAGRRDQDLDELEARLFGHPPQAASPSSLLPVHIDSAYQGAEAVSLAAAARARRTPYFMAFVDIRMPPGIDGIETILRLWRDDPGLHVVICTAFTDYSWEQIAASLGAPPHLLILRKPFDPMEVRQMTASALARWQQASAPPLDRDTHERMLHAVLEIMPEAIVIVDQQGAIEHSNAPARALLGPAPSTSESGAPSAVLAAIRNAVRQLGPTRASAPEIKTAETWSRGAGGARLELHLCRIDLDRREAPRFVCMIREPPRGTGS